MKIGLCLSGGGAKGAYQAGVIKALYDRGLDFSAISGTSIGAINGYYIFTGNVEKLEDMWTNIEIDPANDIKIIDNTVDNSYVIEGLKTLEVSKEAEIDFYVNYIEIKNKNLNEKVMNIKDVDKSKALESIKYSSLLPCNPKATLPLGQQFMKDVSEGLYDGFNLDGGLVNNTLIQPLVEQDLDKIIIIDTHTEYELPAEISDKFGKDNIFIIKPKKPFEKNATLRFEKEFCKKIYNEGYEIGRNFSMCI